MNDSQNIQDDTQNIIATVSFTGEPIYKCDLRQLIKDIESHKANGFFDNKENCIKVKLDTPAETK